MRKRIVIAIDGPAGAGKSTVARSVAARLGFLYIDSGAMYRAIALWALRLNIALNDAHRLEQMALAAHLEFRDNSTRVLLNEEDITEAIRTPEVSAAASKVSAVAGVRRALVAQQRKMAERTSVVMEGRDIGTVVFPDALIKVYLDADEGVRAGRRLRDLALQGGAAEPAVVAAEIAERDRRDRTRADSPLMQAPDAIYLDSTNMAPDEVEEAILKLVRDRTANGKELHR